MITVDSTGSACAVKLNELYDNYWHCVYTTSGVVGRNGVSDKSMEGDYCTPKGAFSLGFAFGSEQMNGLDIEYRQYNENCYWVDDPYSPLYNQWVESTDITWNSAEHLSDYPQAYRYGVVINYNMSPVVPGKGSAIFLHCMTGSYTAGCVAVPESDMLYILNWLDSSKKPVIRIN